MRRIVAALVLVGALVAACRVPALPRGRHRVYQAWDNLAKYGPSADTLNRVVSALVHDERSA
jgi:hypothetical protein